ncbi:MAG: 6,7-dimethyl-8-ribityllumazine synthase [Pseudolabrys sp.]|nr:6,7-dimethyl-8-ribityllumazine synthase [Pseudolabrys sp.]
MARITRGKSMPTTRGLRMLIVEARFYEHIADRLLAGAVEVLEAAGAHYTRVSVPGALEIPPAVAIAVDAAKAKRAPYDGVVALGCVIEGDTYHFEVVANESARGLMDLARAERLAIGNGILTVDNEAQALERSGGAKGNKGADAARAALALARLRQTLKVSR